MAPRGAIIAAHYSAPNMNMVVAFNGHLAMPNTTSPSMPDANSVPESPSSMNQDDGCEHNKWMQLALEQASLAARAGEVPVGAVIVHEGQVIAQAYNQTLALNDPSAHAEMLALRAAAAELGNYRLENCTLYVTLEPCCMCSGAVFQARLKQVVFGAKEPKTGAAGSVVNLYQYPTLNHHTRVCGGVLERECAAMLQAFFSQRRNAHKKAQALHSLRQDALRTPAKRFTHLAHKIPASWSHYDHALPILDGLRMHWLDNQCDIKSPRDRAGSENGNTAAQQANGDALLSLQTPPNAFLPLLPRNAFDAAARPTYVCLAPVWHWSAYWQPLMNECAKNGVRCLAPDLPGWGMSDKPKKTNWHSLSQHVHILDQWFQSQQLERMVLVAHDWQLLLALALYARFAKRLAWIEIVAVNVQPWLRQQLVGCSAMQSEASKAEHLDQGARAAGSAPFEMPAKMERWLRGLVSSRGDFVCSDKFAKHWALWGASFDRDLLEEKEWQQSMDAPYPDIGHAAALKSLLSSRFTPMDEHALAQDAALWREGLACAHTAYQHKVLRFVDVASSA